ncbi:pre-B-cell leukemia transcription factor-interacting protein 1 isoform X4 [Seriola lalandi dorsalis]|uniref:pre-B-cell leukemia transcription factor-interacting protein 1 isoform X4 n=1 Tax=Seriola lalandi dorsalis TaxID=1841481 RepID=UPI000C6FAF83|nr:pre-B-cell leukemia transcription factor-interacting protein 1 isoform X4 [Seriola lalandi dorsalis]
MSGGSSANNSWTILTPEETVAETLRPLAEGTEHHEGSHTSAAGSGANQPAEGEASAAGSPVEAHLVSEEKPAALSGGTSTEQHTSVPTAITDAPVPTSLEVSSSLVPGSDALSRSEGLPEGPAQSSPDPDSFSDSYSHITPSPDEPPASLLSTETLGGMEFMQEEKRLAQEGTLHSLNGEELHQEEDETDLSPRMTDLGKQADSPVDSEVGEERAERTEEEGESEVRRRSLLAALERIGRAEEEEEGEEEFQLPQREEDSGFSVNKCILGAVILLGLGTIFFSGVFMDLDEESDYGTRELKDSEVPRKQEWLNPEVPPPPVDADSTELLNKLVKGNQHISVLQAQLQAQGEELKVAKGQAAEGAKERLRWEEVEKENSRLKTEMASLPVLQTENERMKRELESVPALQKELDTLRSTVTELKRSSAASEAAQAPVKPTPSPPSGQPEDSRQDTAGTVETQARKPWDDQKEKKTDWKKEKHDIGENKGWKERDKTERKEGEIKERKDGGKTEWKKGKHEQGKFDKEKDKGDKQKRHSDETKQLKEKEWKKEGGSRGDEGKPWKAREGKKEQKEKSERKDRKEEKDWKKAKHEKVNEGKQWKGKEEKKDWKGGKDREEKHKGKREWKGEKEWRKVKDGFKGSGNEKWEKKDWKEKGERKEWKKGGEWKGKNGKDEGKDRKGKGERKQWDESENHSKNHGKDRKGKDERKQWNENEWKSKNGIGDKEWKRKNERKQWNENERKSKNGKGDKEWKKGDEMKQWERKEEEWKRGQKEKKHNGDWKKDRSSAEKHKDEHKFSGNHNNDHHEKHEWGDRKAPHTHRRPSMEQPEYWVQQRDRLQHNPKPPQHCNSLETCAQAEGLLPVPFPEFEAILRTYLAKAEEAGVDASKTEELKKLAANFFKDGVFVHDKMSFQDFVEDVEDILEDMVEGDENGEEEEDEEDSAIEQEMEEFEREVMKKFSVPGAGEKEEKIKGEWRKESGRGRG